MQFVLIVPGVMLSHFVT